MEFVKVRKGKLETKVNSKQLNHYIANGWEEVKETPPPKPETYNNYNMKQLKEIAVNRKVTVNSKMRKSDIVDKLLHQDNQKSTVQNRQPNKGFTDNLIIE